MGWDNAGILPHMSTGLLPLGRLPEMRVKFRTMDQGIKQRIGQRLSELGMTPRAASLKAGGSPDLIRGLLRGKQRSFRGENLTPIADVLGVSVSWLLTGEDDHIPSEEVAAGSPPPPQQKEIPILGYVGAGASIYPIDDHSMGDGFDTVPAPPGVLSGVALIVRGDSMWPKYEDGEIIVCEKSQIGLESLIGRTCYVQLSDGRALLKIITRGSSPGYWTLMSHNAPPIENVVIERAYPIAWTKPRR